MKTIELVGYGHPDRFADYISEKILVENLKFDKNSKVAAEVMVTRNIVFLGGEVTSKAKLDYQKLVLNAISEIYGNKWWPDFKNKVKVINDIKNQSPELTIVQKDEIVAADQGVIYGYFDPNRYDTITFLYKIIKHLREAFDISPDWKLLYNKDLKEISISVCGVKKETHLKIHNFLKDKFIKNNLKDTKVIVNPIGEWMIGGPLSDTGVTGRKLMIDTFGAGISHGGGAFCGKDFSKVDKTGVIIASEIAFNFWKKNQKYNSVSVELNYKIGDKVPSVIIRAFDKNKFDKINNYKYKESLNDYIKNSDLYLIDWSNIVLEGGVIFYLNKKFKR